MNNLARTLSILAAVSFLALFAQSHDRPIPELWAAIGVAEPLVFEDPNHDLNISFGLVNDSNIVADTDFGSWGIFINGQKVPDSHWIFGNGPGPAGPGGWERLPARDAFIFGKALPIGKYFPKPGTYEVAWKGSRFSARPAVIRVLPRKK
jgi:hypothetical protein